MKQVSRPDPNTAVSVSAGSETEPKRPRRRVHAADLLRAAPFFIIHLSALGVFFVPFSWGLVALCIGLYYARMFGITAGYHRYFSHRTYKMSRVPQFLMALLGTLATQKGVLWWAANHRHHHKFSDMGEDIHSPKQDGFWWSHVGWILSDKYDETHYDQIQDMAKFPELVWLNEHFLVPPVIFGFALFLLGGLPAFFWGFCLSTVLLWHGTFTINSLSHVFGSRRYETTDTSKNNFLLAMITMGEGWHNNHHCYQSATQQGFFWYEVDASYYLLKMLSWVGITRDLRKPPLALLDAKRVKRWSATFGSADASKQRKSADRAPKMQPG